MENEAEPKENCLQFTKDILPKDFDYCITMAGLYITIFSLILQISSKQAEEIRNKEIIVNDEKILVEDVSNDLLWNCSQDGGGYYVCAFALLIVSLVFVYTFTCVWSLCDKQFSHWVKLASSMIFKISSILLLTTYDVSWIQCLRIYHDGLSYDTVNYNKDTKTLDFKFDESTMNYQLIGSFFSLASLIVCLFLNVCHKYKKCQDYQCYEETYFLPEEIKEETKKVLEFIDSAKEMKQKLAKQAS